MFRCGSARARPHLRRQHARLFSSPAFTDWSKRLSDLKSKYPGLYSPSFVSDQQSLLKDTASERDSLIASYEASRKKIVDSTGFDLFKSASELGADSAQFVPVSTVVFSESEAETKLKHGTDLISRLMAERERTGSTLEERNLAMIRVSDVVDEIDEWRRNLETASKDSLAFGLPIEDVELDEWVAFQFTHQTDHETDMDQFYSTLDSRLADEILAKRDDSFDRAKYDNWCKVSNELFHPTRIDHYHMNNLAKALFRGSLWQSDSRPEAVEQSIMKLEEILNSDDEDFGAVVRRLYELYPDCEFKGTGALQLKLTEPLFAAKLMDEVRSRMERVAFDRAVRDVLRPVEEPDIDARLIEAQQEVDDCLLIDVNNSKRALRNVQAEKALYSTEVPSMKQVLDEVLPTRLWGADAKAVATAIGDYASGKGSMSEVQSALNAAIDVGAKGAGDSLDEDSLLQLMIRYHNAKYDDKRTWSLAAYMNAIDLKSDEAKIAASTHLKERLSAFGLDDLVINLVRQTALSGQSEVLPTIITDYKTIMKNFRGEVDAFLLSAQELDDETFNLIKEAMDVANPGKKITLERQIEPGLGAGFVVKAGVQRFDFSLAAHIDASRKQLAL